MPGNRWIDTTQPQTLLIATFLLYANAVFAVIGGGFADPVTLVISAGEVAAGYGIANEKKWGYGLGIVIAILLVVRLVLFPAPLGSKIISLAIQIALVALLLHPQSREYQRIWFK
jgi:hypothetical protein